MVAMTVKGPLVAANRGLTSAGAGPVRTCRDRQPVRLTRRGRFVVTGVAVLAAGALSVGLATAAQAGRTAQAGTAQAGTGQAGTTQAGAAQAGTTQAGTVQAGAGYATTRSAARGEAVPGRYVARVTVRPGQSLWTLAGAYDPDADPRDVVLRIQQLNSLPGAQLRAGQTLWVPRG